jgi:pyruvate/oxaloacetate carboxyltransferase
MPSRIQFNDLTLRDGQQSLAATRMTTQQMLRVLKMIGDAGFGAIELWGGATLDACVRYLQEDPWVRLDKFRRTLGAPDRIRALLRGQNLFAYQPFPDDLVIAFVKEATRSGVGIMRIFDALNDWRNLQIALLATRAYGGKVEAGLCYTMSPVHTTDYFVNLAMKLESEGADQIAIKDMAGLLYPTEARHLFKALKQHLHVPVIFHSHTTTGVATLNAVLAMQHGIDAIDTAITPFAGGPSHPPVEVLIMFAEVMGIDHGINKRLIMKIQKELFKIFKELKDYIPLYGKAYRPVSFDDINVQTVKQIVKLAKRQDTHHLDQALTLTRGLLSSLKYPTYDDAIFTSQVPGGMISNLQSQLQQMGQIDQLEAILTEIPIIRADVGYVPLVTPTSQIVGSQATFNVMFGRYQMLSNEFKMLLNGEFGMLPAPPNPDLMRQVIGSEQPSHHYRPASYLSPVLEDEQPLPYVKTNRDRLLHLMLKQSADSFLKTKYGFN